MTQIFFLSESSPAKGPEGTHEDTWLWKNVPSSSLSLSPPTMPSAFQSTSDSGQPSWMELAKRKSMAWSDKSMDWEEKHRYIVVRYEQPRRHIMLLNFWWVSQKGGDSTLLRLLCLCIEFYLIVKCYNERQRDYTVYWKVHNSPSPPQSLQDIWFSMSLLLIAYVKKNKMEKRDPCCFLLCETIRFLSGWLQCILLMMFFWFKTRICIDHMLPTLNCLDALSYKNSLNDLKLTKGLAPVMQLCMASTLLNLS